MSPNESGALTDDASVRRRDSWVTWIALGGVISVIAAASFWAGRVVMLPAHGTGSDSQSPVTYKVTDQTVGRSLNFTARATWGATAIARAAAPGVITSVDFEAGATVEAGEVLYTVNLRPAVLALGDIPAFRDLKLGDTGGDVKQLQAALRTFGYYEPTPSGTFDRKTEDATRAWQSAQGGPADGVIKRGDIIYADSLPVRVVPAEALTVGSPVTGGEPLVNALAAAPRLIVSLGPEQSDLVPASASVIVSYLGGEWTGVVAQATEPVGAAGTTLELLLTAADGSPICGDQCVARIPPLGVAYFEVEVVIVPDTTGPVVPTAAIVTDPGGNQAVEVTDGTLVPVTVRASVGGLAVVKGITAGTVVVLPFASSEGG